MPHGHKLRPLSRATSAHSTFGSTIRFTGNRETKLFGGGSETVILVIWSSVCLRSNLRLSRGRTPKFLFQFSVTLEVCRLGKVFDVRVQPVAGAE